MEFAVYRLLMRDQRTPRVSRLLLTFAVFYAISPLNLVPDFIPIIGYVDDVIIIAVLVFLALRAVPDDLLEETRLKAYSSEMPSAYSPPDLA